MAALTARARTGAANSAISENPPGEDFLGEFNDVMGHWGDKVVGFHEILVENGGFQGQGPPGGYNEDLALEALGGQSGRFLIRF